MHVAVEREMSREISIEIKIHETLQNLPLLLSYHHIQLFPRPVLLFHPPSPPLLTHSVLLSVVSSLESLPSTSHLGNHVSHTSHYLQYSLAFDCQCVLSPQLKQSSSRTRVMSYIALYLQCVVHRECLCDISFIQTEK